MAVSEESLNEFIEIYERVEGLRLEREEAREIANRLVAIYRLILSEPIPPPDTQDVEPVGPPSARRRSPRRLQQ
ncbi:MAG: hypothetical protein JWN49_723 [Parcubacteria group bacterium]|nr:hypothetical protein [Parcubacteria group bacterium]